MAAAKLRGLSLCLVLSLVSACHLGLPGGSRHALSDGSEGGSSTTLGFGSLKAGAPFYLLGVQLQNTSSRQLVITSVQTRPSGTGATYVGWALDEAPSSGVFTAYCPDSDGRSAEFAGQLRPVTAAASHLAAHAGYPPDVVMYLEFTIHKHGAYKTTGLRVSYTQGSTKHVQTSAFNYRFQTPDTPPLP